MSSTNVNKEFAQFGKKALILAILSIISFILGIIAWSVAEVGYVNFVVALIFYIVLIVALGNIKNVAKALNNDDLFSFRKRMFIAIILGLIGTLFVVIAVAIIVGIATGPDPGSEAAIRAYISGAIIIIIGIVLLIVALVFEILAWSDLRGFFRDNKSMFPEKIGNNAKTGSLLMMLGAIPFVGWILRIVGCFLLSQLKDLE